MRKVNILEKVHADIDKFFVELQSYSPINIERILRMNILLVMGSQSGLQALYSDVLIDPVDPVTRKNASNFSIKVLAHVSSLLLQFFDEFDIELEKAFNLLLSEDFDPERDMDRLIFDTQKEMYPTIIELETMFGLKSNKDKLTKQKGLYYKLLYEDYRVSSKDSDEIEKLTQLYENRYELCINEIFRPGYDRLKKINKTEFQTTHKTGGRIINFFKKWNNSKYSLLLEGFDPFIRNAIIHKQRGRWSFDFSTQEYIFKDSSGLEQKKVGIIDFIVNFFDGVNLVWRSANFIVSWVESILGSEKEILSMLKNNQHKIKKKYYLFIHFVIRKLSTFCQIYSTNKEDVLDNNIEKTLNMITDELLTSITIPKEKDLLPLFFRYSISDYPYLKPDELKLKISETYLKWVRLAEVDDDIEFVQNIVNELSYDK